MQIITTRNRTLTMNISRIEILTGTDDVRTCLVNILKENLLLQKSIS